MTRLLSRYRAHALRPAGKPDYTSKNQNMEPLLPTLRSLFVFYTMVITLLLMAGLSAYALYRQLRQRPS